MANFDAQITELVGGTIDQTACDQWAVDGIREIIQQLPEGLQEKCSDKTPLTDSPTTLDLNTSTIGKILYCTRNNGSYDIPCRAVDPQYGHLTEDSTASNYYATADDPAFFIRDNKVEIKPTPTATQNGFVYHIVYPSSINVSDVDAIANFPIEAENLLVLFVAMRQLLQFQSNMSSSWNSAIGDALTGAHNVFNSNEPSSTTDAYGSLSNEDIEIMDAALRLSAAQLSEAAARLQQDTAQYQWYGDQYAKLSAEYARALATLGRGDE